MAGNPPELTGTEIIIKQSEHFDKQSTDARKMINDCFLKSHQTLENRKESLLSQVSDIEKDYKAKMKEIQDLIKPLEGQIRFTEGNLQLTKLKHLSVVMIAQMKQKVAGLTTETKSTIEFKWDDRFEIDMAQIGSIQLNSQTDTSLIRTFSPQVKPIVPDYTAKQMPSVYCGKKYTAQKAPGEFNGPRCIAVDYKTGNIYLADQNHNRVQVFDSNGDNRFMFKEAMNKPLGISILRDNVFVTQFGGNCINKYTLKGELLKLVGCEGCDEKQFATPYGVCASDITNNVYVCDFGNNRVQILTENLEYISMFGIGLFTHPCEIKVTRDKIFVLDECNPCLYMFNLDHSPIKRLISRGEGKQTTGVISFDIDRESNLIMSGYKENCVCIFNPEGELIHNFGQKGQKIGDFHCPWGIALDNQGRIIVACHKSRQCLQFF